jgi:hypothetical protein
MAEGPPSQQNNPEQHSPKKEKWTWRHGFKSSPENPGQQEWNWKHGYNQSAQARGEKWGWRYGYAPPEGASEEQQRQWNWLTGYGVEKEDQNEQRGQKTVRVIWQTSTGALGLSFYGLAKAGDLIKWLLKQSKETADIAKGWEEGQAFAGTPK